MLLDIFTAVFTYLYITVTDAAGWLAANPGASLLAFAAVSFAAGFAFELRSAQRTR
jgi:hypothetical protein